MPWNEHHLKIEARRLAAKDRSPLTSNDPSIVAVAADHPVEGEQVPVFGIDDITVIADFVEARTGLAAQ